MKLTVTNGNIFLNGKIASTESVFSENYLRYINQESLKFSRKQTDFSNDLFLKTFVQKTSKYEFYFRNNNIKKIIILNHSKENYFIIDAAKKNDIEITSTPILKLFYSFIHVVLVLKSIFVLGTYILITTFSFLYHFLLKQYKKKTLEPKVFVLIHSIASLKKLKNFLDYKKQEYLLFIDPNVKKTINNNYLNFYHFIKKRNILQVLFIISYKSFNEFISLKQNLKLYNCKIVAYQNLTYFAKRIPHYNLNKYALEKIFQNMKSEIFYSGEKESRWGIIENRLAGKYEKKGVCVPHGLEYSIKFPLGIFGNLFYTTSIKASEVLKNLYPKVEFTYDPEINREIYSSCIQNNAQKKIVYFTEGRNITRDEIIINYLFSQSIDFQIKFHPNDSISNYHFERRVDVIDSFTEAIGNNICIARNSSILLESIFNNSIPVSVLLTPEDRFTCDHLYPSLGSDKIIKCYAVEELLDKLKELI